MHHKLIKVKGVTKLISPLEVTKGVDSTTQKTPPTPH
jgi:hypothetical protein